mgnify:FL=1
MVCEKSRRMLISWVSRAFELWDMGLKRCDGLLIGEDLEAASKHIWRYDELLSLLKQKHPEWKLPAWTTHKYSGEKQLKSIQLANGSKVIYGNGEARGIQGDGLAFVIAEEPSLYPYLLDVIAQAGIVTMGKNGAPGGYFHGITNAKAENNSWQELKTYYLEHEPENVMPEREGYGTGFTKRITPGGEWFVELDWWMDYHRDHAWLEAEKLRMASVPFQFREQILRQDSQVADALWNREIFDLHRATTHPQLVAVGIGIDPSVSDPEKRKNPYKKPDACGMIIGGIDGEGFGYVLEDISGIMSPEKWAQTACHALKKWIKKTNPLMSRVVYESNQGGELVAMAIRNVWPNAPLQEVRASIGKRARAEPIAQVYEQGRVRHVGNFPALERECVTWDSQNPSSPSPNRIDALVWLFHAFGLDRQKNTTKQRFTKQEKPKRYEKRRYLGYQPQPGERIVPRSPEELACENGTWQSRRPNG